MWNIELHGTGGNPAEKMREEIFSILKENFPKIVDKVTIETCYSNVKDIKGKEYPSIRFVGIPDSESKELGEVLRKFVDVQIFPEITFLEKEE